MSQAAYNFIEEKTWGSGDDCLRIYVFGADSVSQDELYEAYYGVKTAASDAYYTSTDTSSDVDYAKVRKYETTIDFNCYGSDEDERQENIRTQFNDWLDDYGFNENGTCLLVTDCNVGVSWNGSWTDRVVAMINTWDYSGEYLRAMAAHEALHGFINHNCDDVNDLTDDDEHQLGSVNVFDEVTALAASYQNSEEHHKYGDCSGSNYDLSSFTAQLTLCTIKALEHSKEHTNTGPWHDW